MLPGLTGLVGIIVLIVLSLANEYQNATQHAQVEVENLSRMQEAQALASMQKADLLLRDVLGDVRPSDMRMTRGANNPRARELHTFLQSHLETVPELSVLHLTNAKGEHIHSSLAELPHIDISDRYHFLRQKNDPNAGLVISPPLISRTTGKWTLILTRRINFEDGSFAGIINAVFEPEYFQEFYRSLNMGEHGVVSLFDRDMNLIARLPQSEKDLGKNVNLYAKTYIEKGITHAVYHAKSGVDGVERLTSFRQVGDLPLFVFSGLADEDYLAAWRHHVWEYGIGAAILGFVVAGFWLRQRRAEAVSQQSADRIEMLLHSVAEGIFGVDMHGNCTFINSAGLSLLGYQEESELIGKYIPPLIHHTRTDGSPYPASECRLYRAQQFQQNIHVDDELFWRKDGSSFPVDYWSRPTRLNGEEGAVVTFMDITQRRQNEEALRKSAEEIEDLYNYAPCGYHSLDKDGVIVRINDTELNWLGYTRDEVIGKMKMSDLLTPKSSQAFQKNFFMLKKRGVLKDIENEVVRKDGSILHGLVSATAVRDDDGEYLTFRSTVFDITDRKKTEETLRSLFTAIEHSPIAVTITDPDANIQYVSPRFSQITGYSYADVIGRNLRILQAGRMEKHTYLEMWNALTSGQVWQGELPSKGKQGRSYWEDIHITPVKTPDGVVSNYVVVSTDITERKIAEEKMHHLANYDQLTDLPNRSLVDDRLRQALAAAKRDKAYMALMFLDLDKFKPINDTFGHDVGDQLLKEAAGRMQGCVRESDTLGRIGGDEFVVLLPTIDSDQHAVLVAEKIRHALNQPFILAGQHLHISSSIGLAIYPEHGDDGKTLVKNADTAMYYAKEGGRNNVRLFNPEMLVSGE